jgi:hypothetical protein
MKAYRWMGMAVAVLMITAGTAWAGSSRLGTAGAPEMRLPVGARSTALAGANVGDVSGVEALYFNPAGLAATDNSTEIMFSHTDYLAGMGLNYFGLGQSMGGLGMFGVSVKVLSVGEIMRTSEIAPDGTGETFSPTFSTLGLTYAKRMTDRVNFGGTAYYVSERIMQETAAGAAFDFGFQYDTGFHGMKLGMAMKNFGSALGFTGSDFELNQRLNTDDPQSGNKTLALSSASFELPSTFQLALSMPLIQGVNTFSLHGLYQNNSFDVDEGRVGAEFVARKALALRAGYKITSNTDDLFGLSYGAGVRVPLGANHMWVEYAGQQVSDFFDNVQTISVAMNF